MQDLADIKEGAIINYQADFEKAKKDAKRVNREKRVEAKRRKYEKLILEHGYDGLDVLDKRRADKVFKIEEIFDLEDKRNRIEPEPEQTSLF